LLVNLLAVALTSKGLMSSCPFEYAVITPVRDEATNLPRLVESISNQTVPAKRWVFVDTGSTDGTLDAITRLASETDWIVATSIDEAATARGGPIVRAFSHGIKLVAPPTDVIVKLDADITVNSTFFEALLDRFKRDKDLGVAGGAIHEWEQDNWQQRYVTDDFVRGGCRAYRWQCLSEVLPLEERIGWDGLDLIKARTRGWKTQQFHDLPVFHHRSVGARERSRASSWYAMGDAMYYMGYRPYYAFVRAMFDARRDRKAVMSIVGFLVAALRRQPRHSDPRVLAYVRKQQHMRNLPKRVKEKLGRR
jgi:glycosyltransferase involved in cell wall biosynthesis